MGSVSRDELTSSLAQLMDKSCVVSHKNMRALLVDAGLDPDVNVFDEIDANHDGKITWEEFSSKLRQVSVDEVKQFSETPKVVGKTPFADENGLVDVKGEEC